MKKSSSDKNNKNKSIYKRVLYYFDIWLSKGTLPTIILLFAVTGVFVFIIAFLAVMFGGQDSLS